MQQKILDSIFQNNPKSKVIVMGDFNDNPSDKSIQSLLVESNYYKHLIPLFNPMLSMAKKGLGSLAYRDQWYLFDQLLLSPTWINDTDFFFLNANIFNPLWLQTPRGRYKVYPFRTHVNGSQLEGFSDHFPVYALFAMRPNQ